MDHFAGFDVSVKETSICIVDDTGRIVREVKAASEPEALLQVLGNPIYRFKRIGLEAGPLTLSSDIIIQTHNHRPMNKREPVFRRTICNAYSITSSARASSGGGKLRSRALAVFRLGVTPRQIQNWNCRAVQPR
jgi:hypothetical protein